jgi:hypothetical protein
VVGGADYWHSGDVLENYRVHQIETLGCAVVIALVFRNRQKEMKLA